MSTIPATMKTIEIDGKGGPEVLVMRERPTPIVVISERSSAGVVDYN